MMTIDKCGLIFLFLLSSSILSSQTPSYRIDGKVDAKYNGALITLFTFTGHYIRSVDSVHVENGRFSFEGPEYLSEKSLLSLGNYPDTVLVAHLLLERGRIEVEMNHTSVVHSSFHKEYKQYRDSCKMLFRCLEEIQHRSEEEIETAWQKLYLYQFRFIEKYIHNGFGRMLFLDVSDSPYFYDLYKLLTEKERQRGDIRHTYEQRRVRDEQQQLAGKLYPDFVLKNSSGKEEKLSDYVGKHQLLFLDFWASWCGPCLAQKQQIRGLYQKYKDEGFGVLGVSLDTDREKWLAVLNKEEILWKNLFVENQECLTRLRDTYCISGIPYGVLIDELGKVVYVVTGGGQELKFLLEAYYKK